MEMGIEMLDAIQAVGGCHPSHSRAVGHQPWTVRAGYEWNPLPRQRARRGQQAHAARVPRNQLFLSKIGIGQNHVSLENAEFQVNHVYVK